jgi:hypothetical protein
MHHPSDALAVRAAAAEQRARALRDSANADLVEAQNQLAKVNHKPIPAFDATAADLELAHARAADQVHGTDTAGEIARRHDAQRRATADAAQARADAAAKLEPIIAHRSSALRGAEAVLAEAIENTRALVAAAARDRLPVVQQAYRASLMAAMDLASDLWALEALVNEKDRPTSRAITTNAVPLTFPALSCFVDDSHQLALRGVGAQASGAAVLLNLHDAQAQALADVARIRNELTAETAEGNL